MAILNRKKNKSLSHKLKRAMVFAGWRRNIGANEKIIAEELRSRQV